MRQIAHVTPITRKKLLNGTKAEKNNVLCISQKLINRKSGRAYSRYCINISSCCLLTYVAQSMGMSHLSAIFNCDFLIQSTCPFRLLNFNPNPIPIGHQVAEIQTNSKMKFNNFISSFSL